MSRATNNSARGRYSAGFALVLVLSGLLLTIGACDSLTAGTSASTATIAVAATETTAAEELITEASVYGSWNGTYTVLQAWDQNGFVEDPPVPVGTPLSMRLELYPLSAATGDCGTVAVPGFGSSRVTAISVNGQEVQLSIVSEEQGRADLRSVFTLTLEGDTLTGEDSGDPAVPSGWVSTSGTIDLTRSMSSDTGGDVASGGGSTGHTASDEVTLLLQAQLFSTTTTERAPIYWGWNEDDDGRTREIHVGDFVTLSFVLHPTAGVTTRVAVSDPQIMELINQFVSSGVIYTNFEAIASGDVRCQAIYVRDDGTFGPEAWTFDAVVVE
jgi:hypothetical protein